VAAGHKRYCDRDDKQSILKLPLTDPLTGGYRVDLHVDRHAKIDINYGRDARLL
jgi:hypothetical protein